MGLSIKLVHIYCSKCGALKVNKNAEVCQIANCGNVFNDEKSTETFFASENKETQ